ncbi:MAG: hypothetical protein C4332_03645 [Meiothermus sp.]
MRFGVLALPGALQIHDYLPFVTLIISRFAIFFCDFVHDELTDRQAIFMIAQNGLCQIQEVAFMTRDVPTATGVDPSSRWPPRLWTIQLGQAL